MQSVCTQDPEVIIVVDDDPALLHALTFALQVEGHSVRSFRDARSLLEAASLPTHGCFIVDYKLPDLDGLELLKRLRARGVAMPAVLITTPTQKVLDRAAAQGIPVVEKPLLDGTLFDLVRKMLSAAAAE